MTGGFDTHANQLAANAAGGLAHKYFCVAKREHPAMVIPGIVRWRWKVKDETIWVSCQRGCCEVDVK